MCFALYGPFCDQVFKLEAIIWEESQAYLDFS